MATTEPRHTISRRPRFARHVRRPAPPTPERGPEPSAPARYRWSVIAGPSGLNVLAGIWLIIAPWVLGYSGRDPRWNDVVFGIVVGVFALTRATGAYEERWLSWVNLLIGVWLFIAAFTIDYTTVAVWNDIILGIVVSSLAVASIEATSDMLLPPRRRSI